MKIRTLTLKNFMPYKGESRIEFPVDDYRNVMIVFGDNMRGKTSLLNALRWGFYGRAIGRQSRDIPLNDLPNRDATLEGDWTVEVRIEFEANGATYDLRRNATKRASVATPQRPDDYICQVHLTKNGIPIQGDLVEAEINQVAPEQISRFFLFDGELLQEYETLLIEGSTQGGKIKDAIEQVLGVPSLIHGRDELETLLKAARKSQQQDLAHMSGLEKLAEQQSELARKQDQAEKNLHLLRNQLSEKWEERTSLDEQIAQDESIFNAKKQLDLLMDRQRSVEENRDSKRAERLDILGQAWRDLVEIRVGVRRQLLEEEQSAALTTITKRAEVEARIKQLQALLSSRTCPTCLQALSEERRAEIGGELGTLEGQRDQLSGDLERFQATAAQIAILNKIRGISARDRLAKIDEELQGSEVELTKIDNNIEKLRSEIEGYDTAEIARRRALRDVLLKEEGRLERDIAAQQSDLTKLKNDLAIAQKSIEGQSQARTSRSTKKVHICQQLEEIFDQSVDRLRDQLRESVEARATEAFQEMTTQKAYRGLAINKNYGLTILDELGQPVALRSAGAEQVVALSLIDGLNRTGRAAGPIVMDTPFGRLDLNHRDNILSYLPTVTSQFVLLVHSGEIRPDTDLDAIAARVGAQYHIREISPRHSIIERVTS
jgi:DNA sulfur modification protein DndD